MLIPTIYPGSNLINGTFRTSLVLTNLPVIMTIQSIDKASQFILYLIQKKIQIQYF